MSIRKKLLTLLGVVGFALQACQSTDIQEDEFAGIDTAKFDVAKPTRFIIKFKQAKGLKAPGGGVEPSRWPARGSGW